MSSLLAPVSNSRLFDLEQPAPVVLFEQNFVYCSSSVRRPSTVSGICNACYDTLGAAGRAGNAAHRVRHWQSGCFLFGHGIGHVGGARLRAASLFGSTQTRML